jgi:hypothetical protein
MDRTYLIRCLSAYIEVLETAMTEAAHTAAWLEYVQQLAAAKQMLKEFTESGAVDRLQVALRRQLLSYRMSYLAGREAESVGGAFGNLRRAVERELEQAVDGAGGTNA